MIENKKLGIKIAEDKDEAFWNNLKEKVETETRIAKATIELNEYIMPFIIVKIESLQELKSKSD